jgi:hypothetical protein
MYDYGKNTINYPVYDLNPEIIESSYYLKRYTGKEKYLDMASVYWQDLKDYCRTEVAFTSVENVVTNEKRDYMPTFFFAETLKYFYLIFSDEMDLNPDDYVFNTEAHPFKKNSFKKELIREKHGIE